MADVGPNKKRIAKLLRSLGTNMLNERRTVYEKLVNAMRDEKVDWSDVGNAYEQDEGKYTEAEMQEFAQAARAEGVDAGIKIGQARTSNGGSNGHFTLPGTKEMAEYCHQQFGRLKNDWQREFVTNLLAVTRRTSNLSPGRLAKLMQIYVEYGGKV